MKAKTTYSEKRLEILLTSASLRFCLPFHSPLDCSCEMRSICVSLVWLSVICGVFGGSCDWGDENAPKTTLRSVGTYATVWGSSVQVNPYLAHNDTILEKDYIRARVSLIREINSLGGECLRAGDVDWGLDRPAYLTLNISECSCTHTLNVDHFAGTTVRRDFVRVHFECPGVQNLSLTLDVSHTNDSHIIAHPTYHNSSLFTYDNYRYGTTIPKMAHDPTRAQPDASRYSFPSLLSL